MYYKQEVFLVISTFVTVVSAFFDVVSTTPYSTNTDNSISNTTELKFNHLEEKLKQLEEQIHKKRNISQFSPYPVDFLTTKYPKDCKIYQELGAKIDGVYRIQPNLSSDSFLVLCDLQTRGGGWTYLLNRYDGSQNFNLHWDDYKNGFGNFNGEFWLGLEKLRLLIASTQITELLVELVDWNDKKVYAHYNYFNVGNEEEGYILKVSGYSGTAGDSLKEHVGIKFSTRDKDQDTHSSTNCALTFNGGWWFTKCFYSKLTGNYLNEPQTPTFLGIHWYTFHPITYSLKQARMMIRSRKLWN